MLLIFILVLKHLYTFLYFNHCNSIILTSCWWCENFDFTKYIQRRTSLLIFSVGSSLLFLKISEQKIFLKYKFVLDWSQGLTKLDFDTEDQVLFSLGRLVGLSFSEISRILAFVQFWLTQFHLFPFFKTHFRFCLFPT